MKILNLSKLSLACAMALIAAPLMPALHAADAPATTPATGTESKPATDDKDKDKPERKRERPPGGGERGPRPGGLAERLNRATPEERAKLETELGLTDDQKAKLKTAADKFKTDATAIKEDKTLTDEKDKRAKMREVGKTFADSLDTILTPEQKEKLKDIQKKHMEEMAQRRKPEGKPGDKPEAPAPPAPPKP